MVCGDGEREDDGQPSLQDPSDDILREAAHTWQFQNQKGGEKAKEGGLHGRHEEGLGCRQVDLRGKSGLVGVGRSSAGQLMSP